MATRTSKPRRKRPPRVYSSEVFRGMVLRNARAYAARVAASGMEDDIAELVGLVADMDAIVAEGIGALRREQGFSSTTIAGAIGTTPQNVRKRWPGAPRFMVRKGRLVAIAPE